MENATKFYELEGSQPQKKYAEQALFETIVRTKPNKLMEVGCGDGHLLGKLSERFPQGNFIGLEYSLDMVAESIDSGVKIIQGDVTDSHLIKEHEKEYDCVISNYVLSELNQEGLKKAFFNMKHFLKPGGKLLFTMTDPRTRGECKEFDGYKLDFEDQGYNYYSQDLPFKVLLWDGKEYVDVGIKDFHNPLSVYQDLMFKANFRNIKISDIKREEDNENFAVLFEAERNIYS